MDFGFTGLIDDGAELKLQNGLIIFRDDHTYGKYAVFHHKSKTSGGVDVFRSNHEDEIVDFCLNFKEE